MNKRLGIIAIFIFAGTGIILVSVQNRKTISPEQTKPKEVKQTLQSAFKQVLKTKDVKELEKSPAQNATGIDPKINEYTTRAQALFNKGRYQQAIDMAYIALRLDENNVEVKSIIEAATTKLTETLQ